MPSIILKSQVSEVTYNAGMTERLKKCFKAGSAVALFPLLSTWSQDELTNLLADIETLESDMTQKIDTADQQEVFRAVNFLNRLNARSLDKSYECLSGEPGVLSDLIEESSHESYPPSGDPGESCVLWSLPSCVYADGSARGRSQHSEKDVIQTALRNNAY